MFKRWQIYFSLFLLFILGCKDGYIALWTDRSPEPTRIFPYSVVILPEADRKALEQGISIDDPYILARLLEDYLS